MMKTTAFDPADYLDTPEAQEELIADSAASGDARYIAIALGTIARARGMTKVAKALGLRITFSDAA
jgi:probable addiction module antidote protein